LGIEDVLDLEEPENPEKIIRRNIPTGLQELALATHQAIKEIGEKNISAKKSGNGITFYKGNYPSQGKAFLTLQPNYSGKNHSLRLRLLVDPTTKKGVNGEAKICEKVSDREIPEDDNFSDSFRYEIDIRSKNNIDEGVKKAIKESYNLIKDQRTKKDE